MPACANHFAEAIKSDSIYYDKSTMDIALKRTYKTERKIAIAIAGGLNNAYNVWDYDVEKYRRVGDFDLTDEQIQMLCAHKVKAENIYADIQQYLYLKWFCWFWQECVNTGAHQYA